MEHSENIPYSDGVSEKEERKFNRELIKHINIYIQDTLKTLRKNKKHKESQTQFI